jgi:hypothetical protein
VTQRGALTGCQPQREGQVRTPRESETAKGTHELSGAAGDKSGHNRKARGEEKLTGYRAEREGQIRTIRECENASHGGTHFLSRPGGWTSQDSKRKRDGEGYSRTVKHRRKDKSGCQAKRKSDDEGHSRTVGCKGSVKSERQEEVR